ncbi:uncharacterized protein LOC124920349 isoform X2 [Impatiens glandulifera]|uniref:uncharacterized protein LOC124920349 isoform X2 n=1 Tax=Impatiens glandulifera TaxID=253017 RepID=UPI001FB1823B|nr:uncharacterized protein LOC124920349 isoform X2 [Impatiens glandulifera]
MHATLQPGGRSPKQMNSDSIQTPTSFPSHGKGKKRERSDHGPEAVKRERSVKTEDGDLGQVRPEINLKSEISKITEKGGLIDTEGVEKLVLLMQSDRTDRKLELNSRSMLAAVVAATDRFDCLSQFVQLKGLSVLDEWLQDVHKGKIGDVNSKDGDKHVEDFLVVLLRALDKLPVNLQALQMCNIGKSVNHLRTHKNLEIQKKARSLVDTWKKRVEAEMNVIDAKSGSPQAGPWPSRSRIPEVSHPGIRQTGGSSMVATRSSVTMVTASKTPIKPVHGELAVKSTSPTGPAKSAMSPASGNDGQFRLAFGSPSDIPSNAVREDRSSSSSQSHNNSQSCSSDHTKTMVSSGKEDARSSTAGSMSLGGQTSGGGSRHRKSVNGYAGPTVPGSAGSHREIGTSRSSRLHKSQAPEKDAIDGNSHKIVVKIPNRGLSPQSVSGGSVDDPSLVNSRAVSPLQHDNSDPNVKEKIDSNRPIASEVNAESWQSNDLKDMLSASDEADGSPEAIREDQSRPAEDASKFLEVPKVASSSLGNEHKAGKMHESSLNSMNALIESVKYSETNASPSDGDDAGMNLLASVAADEILAECDAVPPKDSPHRSVPLKEDLIMGDEAKVKSLVDNNVGDDRTHHFDDATTEAQKLVTCPDDSLSSRDAPGHVGMQSSDNLLKMRNISSPKFEPSTRGVGNEDPPQAMDQCPGNDGRPDELMGVLATTTSVSVSPLQRLLNNDDSKNLEEKVSAATNIMANGVQNGKSMGRSSSLDDDKTNTVSSVNVEKETIGDPLPADLSLRNEVNKSSLNEGVHLKREGNNDEMLQQPSMMKNGGMIDETNNKGSSNQTVMHKYDQVVEAVSSSFGNVPKVIGNLDLVDENKENVKNESAQGMELHVKPKGCLKKTEVKADESNHSLAETSASAVRTSGSEIRLKFDLNEGFVGDESNGFSTASITVAAAAKGPFVYPDDLMKSKGEPGWKGSAATSAFRPAEPRKALEMPLSSSTAVPNPDSNTGKNSRRPVLDFDLNVPDEGVIEDMTSRTAVTCSASAARSSSGGGLDLDLNQVDEASEMMGQYLVRSGCNRTEAVSSFLAAKQNCDVRRDFDLNDGPAVDETNTEPLLLNQYGGNSRSIIQSQPPPPPLASHVGNFSPWFPPGNTYSPIAIPSEQPFPRILGSSSSSGGGGNGGIPFISTDVYRGQVLSSSPAVQFPTTPFQYPVFPFGTSFSLPSGSFSGGSGAFMDSSGAFRVNSQLLGQCQYPRPPPPPYVVSIQESSSVVDQRKWGGRQSLDLNAGPGGLEIEGKDETALIRRELSLASSQSLAEEQVRMMMYQQQQHQKKKGPDGGWDKQQASWQ